MPIQMLMPALSPTMTEGNLAKWLKKEGDQVAPGDLIAEVETDKATMEIEAIEEGVLGKILVAEGTENVAVNTPIQGSAADVIKRAMIDLEARLAASDLQAQLLLQVHDELVLEVPENELDATRTLGAECMEGAVELDVPLKVDFGHGANWLEAH